MTSTALIAGGGIGGLATALALHQHGWQVRALEQAPEFGDVGSAIALWPNAMSALDRLGVGEAVRGLGREVTSGGIRTSAGATLMAATPADMQRRFGHGAMVHRADLHRVLLEAFPAGVVQPGRRVDDVVEHADHVTVRHGEREEQADLLVGADGIQSTVRERLWPAGSSPRYGGQTAWRAIAEFDAARVTGGETWGDGMVFGMMPLAADRVYYYGAARIAPGHTSPDGELAELWRRFGDWPEPIPDLLTSTTESAVLRHDLYELPALPGYVRRRVALLGDAAHAMMPNLGQGACQAIEDGVVLGQLAGTRSEVPTLLRAYDDARRRRTQAIARRAARIATVSSWTWPPAVTVRNTVLRTVPARAGLRALAPVLDWRPA